MGFRKMTMGFILSASVLTVGCGGVSSRSNGQPQSAQQNMVSPKLSVRVTSGSFLAGDFILGGVYGTGCTGHNPGDQWVQAAPGQPTENSTLLLNIKDNACQLLLTQVSQDKGSSWDKVVENQIETNHHIRESFSSAPFTLTKGSSVYYANIRITPEDFTKATDAPQIQFIVGENPNNLDGGLLPIDIIVSGAVVNGSQIKAPDYTFNAGENFKYQFDYYTRKYSFTDSLTLTPKTADSQKAESYFIIDSLNNYRLPTDGTLYFDLMTNHNSLPRNSIAADGVLNLGEVTVNYLQNLIDNKLYTPTSGPLTIHVVLVHEDSETHIKSFQVITYTVARTATAFLNL